MTSFFSHPTSLFVVAEPGSDPQPLLRLASTGKTRMVLGPPLTLLDHIRAWMRLKRAVRTTRIEPIFRIEFRSDLFAKVTTAPRGIAATDVLRILQRVADGQAAGVVFHGASDCILTICADGWEIEVGNDGGYCDGVYRALTPSGAVSYLNDWVDEIEPTELLTDEQSRRIVELAKHAPRQSISGL